MDIGEPQRTIIIEPATLPVPQEPAPRREPIPRHEPAETPERAPEKVPAKEGWR